jgi:hypothetical protein
VANAIEDQQQETRTPFSGGRKPTPATRIVGTQDSNAAASATGGTGAGGASGCWGAGIDRRVSSSPVAPSPFFTFLLLPYMVPLLRKYENVCDRRTLAGPFSFSRTPDAHLRAAIATSPKFWSTN